MRASRLLTVLLALASLWSLTVLPASAHTDVASSDPAADEVVGVAPSRVSITFDEPLLEGGDHAIAVFADDGETRIDDDTTTVDAPETISVGVAPTTAGANEVRWVILAEDGDEQRGDFSFTVDEPTTGRSPVEAEPAPSSLPEDEGTVSSSGLVIAIVALTVVGFALALVLRRGRTDNHG